MEVEGHWLLGAFRAGRTKRDTLRTLHTEVTQVYWDGEYEDYDDHKLLMEELWTLLLAEDEWVRQAKESFRGWVRACRGEEWTCYAPKLTP